MLPRLSEEDPIELVKPVCLQMGWCKSPPLFCTASETACDAAQDLLDAEADLPEHPLETYCLPEPIELPPLGNEEIQWLLKLLEVYMDDFMGLVQSPSYRDLEHFTRAILYGIHKVFPPPGPNDDPDDEPIAIKKLKQGDGRWATSKEILGWFFDGVRHCMSLPPEKVTRIMDHLKMLAKQKMVRLKELEKLTSKLMHAMIGIPNGRGLLSPIIATVATKAKLQNYKNKSTKLNQATRQALQDWIMLLPCALCQPTPCADLMPALADFGGFCDASKQGAGGVWFGFNKKLPPIVWRVQFPADIQTKVVSQDNPHGSITNSDLEMTGLLLQWLVLEKFTNLEHAHVAIWCDNTPTVAWATKLLATKAVVAARLLRTLALRMIACQASPLTMLHVPSDLNNMADFASRSFSQLVSTCEFLTEFQNHFTLPQDASWIHCQLPSETIGCILANLLTMPSGLALWRRHTQCASITGGIGANSFPPVSIHTFKE